MPRAAPPAMFAPSARFVRLRLAQRLGLLAPIVRWHRVLSTASA